MHCGFYSCHQFKRDSHFKLRAAVRKVTDSLAVEAREFEESGTKPSDEFMKKLGDNGLLAANIGPGPWLHGMTFPGGVKGEEFDYFHEVQKRSDCKLSVKLTRKKKHR